jgi:signal transduction histidine kinase
MALMATDRRRDALETSRSDQTILVFAPTGRDAPLTCDVLKGSHLEAQVCRNMDDFCRGIADGAGAGILTEEALSAASIQQLADALDKQPPWSDFPCIVLLNSGEPSGRTLRILELLKPIGNMTLLERPVRVNTLLTVARSALRGRERQYQIRDYLVERKKSEEALERSNEDLERFAYAASHDLKEPLRLIGSYVQLLKKRYAGEMGEDADEYINYVVSSVKRMDELIGDLLAYSRVGTSERNFEENDCEAILKWTIMNLQMAINETGALVTYDPLPTVCGDQSQMVQLFQNLLSNAIKYRGEEPPRIHVSAVRQKDEWVFSVRDNGLGIDPKYHKQVFGIFKRLHGRERPGTGIGLAICQRIVERHGGRLWVESEPGRGSTFFFTIPA